MFIGNNKLTNLIWIIDNNNLQLSGRVNEIMSLNPLDEKLRAFGFDVKVIDGHNYDELMLSLRIDRNNLPSRPIAIIANTMRGKGVSLIENKLGWHARKPNNEEFSIIFKQLGMQVEAKDEKRI